MNRNEAKDFIKKQSPKSFLEPDKQNRGFICPFCGNGSGQKGDGIRRIPRSDSYKCFTCDKAADIFDLIGAKFSLDGFNEQFNKAVEIYGVDVDKTNNSTTSNQPASTKSTYQSW